MQMIDLFKKFSRLIRSIKSDWQRINEEYDSKENQRSLLLAREKQIKNYFDTHQTRKLHIGSGTNLLQGWLNTDIYPINIDILFLDATEIFPFKDQCLDYVYSEHMIEHITFKDALYMLSEISRILKPGGKVRISTPDIEKISGLLSPNKTDIQKSYLKWSAVEMMGLYDQKRSKLQTHRSEWDINNTFFEKFFPDPKTDPACFVVNNFFRSYGHKFLFDEKTLVNAIKSVNFVNINRYSPGESDDDQLKGIEQHDSVVGNMINQYESLVIEATRQ